MKKIMTILLAAMLVISLSTVAFASTVSTNDEAAKTAESIELTKLPDKLEYTMDDCEFYFGDEEYDEDEIGNMTDDEFDEFYDNLIGNGILKINVDFDGAVLTANYSDKTSAVVDNSECSVEVVDPLKLSDLDKYNDLDIDNMTDEEYIAAMEEMLNLIYREYTVEVTYAGLSTTYTIELVIDDFDDYDSIYEFVSYDNPSDRTYSIEDDVYETVIYDDDDNEIAVETVDIDTTGMTVVLKDKETGELLTFDEDNAYFDIEFFHYTDADEPLKAGDYYAVGAVYTDDLEVVYFDYKITLTGGEDSDSSNGSSSTEDEPITDDSDNESGVNSSTSDTAKSSSSSDTVAASSSDNGAVQTGEAMPAAILIVLISGAVAAMYFYRIKFGFLH